MIWLAVGTARQETCREVGWEPQAKLALSLPRAPQRYTQTRWYGTSEGLSLEEGTPGARPSRFPREHPVHPSYPVTPPPTPAAAAQHLPCLALRQVHTLNVLTLKRPLPALHLARVRDTFLCVVVSACYALRAAPIVAAQHSTIPAPCREEKLQWVLTCLLL